MSANQPGEFIIASLQNLATDGMNSSVSIQYLLYPYLQIVPDPEPLQLSVRVVLLVVERAPEADGLVEVVADVEGGVVGGPVLVVDEPGHLLRARRV